MSKDNLAFRIAIIEREGGIKKSDVHIKQYESVKFKIK